MPCKVLQSVGASPCAWRWHAAPVVSSRRAESSCHIPRPPTHGFLARHMRHVQETGPVKPYPANICIKLTIVQQVKPPPRAAISLSALNFRLRAAGFLPCGLGAIRPRSQIPARLRREGRPGRGDALLALPVPAETRGPSQAYEERARACNTPRRHFISRG